MNKALLGIIAVSLVAILGVSMVTAFGFGNGFMGPNLSEEQKAELKEQRDAVKDAIENEDYESWKALMEEKIAGMQDMITEENFNELVERHQERSQFREQMKEAYEAGDYEEMQELKEQYGFKGKGNAFGKGFGDCPMAE